MATVCEVNKISSNVSGLSYAEEVCPKVLPSETNGDASDPIWRSLEPNSYSDFGGELKTVARSPINASRQNQKGAPVGIDASGGFNSDFVNDPTLLRLYQGFLFADLREKPTTQPMNGALNNIGAVTAGTKKYALGATGVAFNKAGYLVLASGFNVAANNGVKTVVSADADDVTVSEVISDEADGALNSKLEVVGYQGAAGDIGMVKTGNVLSITSTAAVFAGLGLIPGEWVFIGGDAAATHFATANCSGFARVKSVVAGAIVFDDVTFTGATDAGAAKTIRLFFGNVLKNENVPALIKQRSYQFERTLGMGATDFQAEYLEGAFANELKLNIPEEDKLTIDLSFVACDHTQRSGEAGDEIKSADPDATLIAALGADALNSTSHVYRMKMHINDAANSNAPSLFGFVTEGNISINNGMTPDKAVGVFGAFDATPANFAVTGSLTAYFSTVEAVRAVRNNADVGFSIILAAENGGSVFDIPLLGLGGGRLNVEKDQSIKIPLEANGAANANGYTMLYNVFPYLPDVAMTH